MSISEVLLTLFYTAIFSFIIFRLNFFKRFQLATQFIVGIFILKIITGVIFGIFHARFYDGGDTYAYFTDSKIVFDTLKNDPWLYLRLVFGFSYANPATDIVSYKDAMMFYTTPGSYLLVRFHSLLRLVSFGYYNVHVVFYNFLTLIGLLYLFLFFQKIVPHKKSFLAVAVFIFPSILFWSSGIHKDGISLAALGLMFFHLQQIATTENVFQKRNLRIVFGLVLGFWLLLIVRIFWLLLLIPALTGFIWTLKYPKYSLLKFTLTFVLYFGIASNLNSFLPEWDFLNLIVQKQNEFMSLPSGSIQLNVEPLVPAIPFVLKAIPDALVNCLLKPWFAEVHSPLQFFAALENVLLLIIFFSSLVFKQDKFSTAEKSLLWLCLFFAFAIFSLIGMIVPILGALIRYKMIGELFLLIAAIVLIKEIPFTTKRKNLPTELLSS